MEQIFHILGVCPDSFSHTDILDIVVCYYNEIQAVINLIKIRFQ